ncbi:MAG: hypothetical protein HY738_06035 [Bacteroidia bacterium]|nr:hypothetical protein [Bacteroidia bacterium]
MKTIFMFFKKLFLIFLLIVLSNYGYSVATCDNLCVDADSICDGRIKLRTTCDNNGNKITDYIWVQYKGTDSQWHTIFWVRHVDSLSLNYYF